VGKCWRFTKENDKHKLIDDAGWAYCQDFWRKCKF
jgi:hypothetical protein